MTSPKSLVQEGLELFGIKTDDRQKEFETFLSKWGHLQRSVSEWSKKNFGDQRSKWMKDHILNERGEEQLGIPLGPIAPMMGMVEEIGELGIALNNLEDCNSKGGQESCEKYLAEVLDCLADITIYLFDYTGRMEIWCSRILWEAMNEGDGIDGVGPSIAIGLVAQAMLKRHQGIREVGKNPEVFNKQVHAGLVHLVRFIYRTCNLHGWDYYEIVEATCIRVLKRDWVAAPSDGGA